MQKKYIDFTTIWVTRDQLGRLDRLKMHKNQANHEVIERLIKEAERSGIANDHEKA